MAQNESGRIGIPFSIQGNFESTLEFLIPFLFFFCRKVKTFLKQKSTEMNVFFPPFFFVDTLIKLELYFFSFL